MWVGVFSCLAATFAQPGAAPPSPPPGAARAARFGPPTLVFEPNSGESDPSVRFVARGLGYSLFLTDTQSVMVLLRRDSDEGWAPPLRPVKTKSAVLRMKLFNARPHQKVAGVQRLPGTANYFLGNDPKKWRTNVPTYAKVRFGQVYPGIDLLYHGDQGRLEYDFIVSPGAHPEQIQVGFEGAGAVRVDERGDLVLETSLGDVHWRKPVAYQEQPHGRQAVEVAYALKTGSRMGFAVGPYDASKPLIVDPVLAYSTRIGGGDWDYGQSIAVDQSGSVYVTGYTYSKDFPVVKPVQAARSGSDSWIADAFVLKLDPAGSSLVYSTYLGGSQDDRASSVAVDNSGNAYITGSTQSPDFPAVNAFQKSPGSAKCSGSSCSDAFAVKLNPTGSGIVYSTYLGGAGTDAGQGIAVDSAGSAYIAGKTASTDFPTAHAFQPTRGAPAASYSDAFITKLSPSGSSLVYSTYLGGNKDDGATAVAVDARGAAYVAGCTSSPDLPTVNPLQPKNQGYVDNAFVTKFDATGSALVYSTFLGGTFSACASSIALDSSGNAYVGGTATSIGFPTVNAFQSSPGNGTCYTEFGNTPTACATGFVSKINAAGSALVYSTYLGGESASVNGIAVDSSGSAYITGTAWTGFPIVRPVQAVLNGSSNVFVAKFSASGSALVFSTYLGGYGARGTAIAVDGAGNAYVTGDSNAYDDWPIVSGPPNVQGDEEEVFVAKITETPDQCSYKITLTQYAVPEAGGENTIGVTAGPGCPWNSISSAGWITVLSGSSGTGSGSTRFSVAQNEDPQRRTGILTVAGQIVTVVQESAIQPIPVLSYVSPSQGSGNISSLFVYGRNFVRSSIVRVNGKDQSAQLISSSMLEVGFISMSIFSGTYQVTVFTPPTGGGESNSLPITVVGNAPAYPTINVQSGVPGVVDGAGFTNKSGLAPGSIASLFGTRLSTGSAVAAGLPLPKVLAGTSLLVNGAPAPLFAVSPAQINFQIPWESSWEESGYLYHYVAVLKDGVMSTTVKVFNEDSTQPEIFSINSSGSGQGAILNAVTGELAAPSGSVPGARAAPVARGEPVAIYCTNLSAYWPRPPSGSPAPADPPTEASRPQVMIGGIVADVLFAGLAPGYVGLYQVNAVVPPASPTGNAVPVQLSDTRGKFGSNTVTIAVK